MPFDPRQRAIFTYFDGSIDPASGQLRPARADPIALYVALVQAAGGQRQFDELWTRAHASKADPDGKQVAEGLPAMVYTDEAMAERSRLAAVIRQAFGMPEFDAHGGEGLTDREVLETIYDFNAWSEKKSQKDDTSPNTSPPSPDSQSNTTL